MDTSRKIVVREEAVKLRGQMQRDGKRVVFTNGCFDILHAGHVEYLTFARNQGDALFVGLNTDASVKRHKGPNRPIVSETYRARLIAALEAVDCVILFDEDEPIDLIQALLPDILVKGADWAHYVSGRDIVEANGGRIVLAPLVDGFSTTAIIHNILKTQEPGE